MSNLQKLYICSMRILLLISFLLIISCDNEIDINDEWQDIPVVYAIFDSGSWTDGDGSMFANVQTDLEEDWTDFNRDGDSSPDTNRVNFVRIQKSFLGQPADNFIGVYDSIYYSNDTLNNSLVGDDFDGDGIPDQNDPLNVWVNLVNNNTGEVSPPQFLDLVEWEELASLGIVKEEDEDDNFNTEDFYLFKLPSPQVDDLCGGCCQSNQACENMPNSYLVSFLNTITGVRAGSETNIVQPLEIYKPRTRAQFSVLNLTSPSPVEIEVEPSRNAKMYSITLTFNYLQQHKSDYDIDVQNGLGQSYHVPTVNVDTMSVVWTLLDGYVIDDLDQLNGTGARISEIFYGQAFFDHLKNQIIDQDMANPDYYRYPLYTFYQDNSEAPLPAGIYHRCIDIEIVAINTELYTYYNASLPGFGINQERPKYNNISNGIGHVSSRSIATLKNLRIDASSGDSLSFGQITNELNFACYKDLGLSYLQLNFPPYCD